MTKVSGPTTQEVGTLPEGVGQVSPLAVRPQLLLPPLCHAEAWQPFLEVQKIHRFFKSPNSRLVVNVASLSTPIIALLPSHCRPEIHFIARRLTLPCPESLLHYLASCHVFISHLFSTSASCAPAIVILISGPRLHHPRHRLGIFRLSHLRTPLCLCTRSVVLISRLFYPATRIPRRRVLVFGHRYRYLRYPRIVLVRHLHCIYVNKPIIILLSISSST